jgi:hypothetical protein
MDVSPFRLIWIRPPLRMLIVALLSHPENEAAGAP